MLCYLTFGYAVLGLSQYVSSSWRIASPLKILDKDSASGNRQGMA